MCETFEPTVYDETQVTSRGNYSNPKAGESHPLASGARPPMAVFVRTDDTLEKWEPSEESRPLRAAEDKYPNTLLTSSAEGSRARTSAWPDSDAVSAVSEADCSLSLLESWAKYGLDGSSSRMFPDCSAQTVEEIWELSSIRWLNSGMGGPTGHLTHDTSESPSEGVESTLSDILEAPPLPQRFYLSARACAGILRRAERRGKMLPPRLEQALRAMADSDTTSITKPASQGHSKRATGRVLDSRQRSTSSVRRLTPTECERLQALPDGWTHDHAVQTARDTQDSGTL